MFLPTVHITGERSIRFAFGNNIEKEIFIRVQQFCEMVDKESHFMIEETVPSYHTVTVYLKKDLPDMEPFICSLLSKWERHEQEKGFPLRTRKLRIPVCYSEEFALDMHRVMDHTGLSDKDIIQLHSSTLYTVYMIGFLPGFPYLGGMNEKLITPRLTAPRLKVPKGTVGIGCSQTGIYPLECPGGWNIIGKTPIEIYLPDRANPFLLRTGDRLEFYPISNGEFLGIKEKLKRQPELIQGYVEEGWLEGGAANEN